MAIRPATALVRMEILAGATKELLKRRDILDELSRQNFDIGFGNFYHFASVGILKALNITSTVFLPSGPHLEHVYWYLGCPVPWSYMPSVVSPFGDQLSLFERLRNVYLHISRLYMYLWHLLPAEQQAFRDAYGADFPDFTELASNYKLSITNKEEMWELPQPTVYKTAYISGIGTANVLKPLSAEFDDTLSKGKNGVVVFSLGTVANSAFMPDRLRKALFNSFKRLPDYHFIVRFTGDAIEAANATNIDIVDWLPQKEILNDERLRLFITHGGYNSLLEATRAGVPMILIPLFGDQMGNALRAEQAGVGLRMRKLELTENSMLKAMAEVLTNPGYRRRATRLAEMIASKPQTAEERLVKWSKFLVKFKTVDVLRPASADLTFVEYFSLDILFVFHALIFACVYLVSLFQE